MRRARDLGLATHQGIELPLGGQLGQIRGERGEGVLDLFAFLARLQGFAVARFPFHVLFVCTLWIAGGAVRDVPEYVEPRDPLLSK